MSSLDQSLKIKKYINRYIKKSIDELVYQLENKLDCEFSASTENKIALQTIQFINTISDTITSENIKEREKFIPDYITRSQLN